MSSIELLTLKIVLLRLHLYMSRTTFSPGRILILDQLGLTHIFVREYRVMMNTFIARLPSGLALNEVNINPLARKEGVFDRTRI